MPKKLPPIETLRKLLDYDPETGALTWKPRGVVPWDSRFAGKEAGTLKDGYIIVSIDYHLIRAHRMGWAMYHGAWPDQEIDHENGDRADNRIKNLREATSLDNKRNLAKSSRNKSGVVGVFWNRKKRRWQASISVNNKSKHLGYFAKKADAIATRRGAEQKYGFHKNHGR